jgi:hypothetical protein
MKQISTAISPLFERLKENVDNTEAFAAVGMRKY